MYLYGASGHAKVIIEILELLNIPVEGLFDDNPDIKQLLGYPVFGRLEVSKAPSGRFVISVGNNRIRKDLSERYPVQYAHEVVHPTATLSKRVQLGEGSVVMGHAIVNVDTFIGKHVIINTSASVDHDCLVEDFVHIAPNATLCGGVTIGEGSLIGAGSVVAPNIKIGKWVTIGAGASVFRDVEDYAVVVGNPGRVIKKVKRDE